ncbi:MAG: hypothetical protein KH382_07035 [Clostridiales bacterium]|jgi:hypothetical protein|nr:hypothetical protein [Clostridiales bacterium]
MNHILLELYCLKEDGEVCCSNIKGPNYLCLKNNCKFLDYTTCENTFCYINEKSEMEEGISFGGEMIKNNVNEDVDNWKKISLKKIEEGYMEYMNNSH